MIIERDPRAYTVSIEETLGTALLRISENQSRIVFCLDPSGQLVGSLSDGDIRRWMVSSGTTDLDQPIGPVARRVNSMAPRMTMIPNAHSCGASRTPRS